MAIITLTQGKYTVVDEDDVLVLRNYKWWAVYLGSSFYAATKVEGKRILMHRMLLGFEVGDGNIVDHIDGNGLNNRKANLRPADRFINMRNRKTNKNNTSGKSGLYFRANHGSAGSWVAVARRDGRFVSKTFGCLRRGYDTARTLAEQWRDSHEKEYNITVR